MSRGTLHLVATPIGNLQDISERALHTLRGSDIIVCEDTRHTKKLLTHFDISGKDLVAMHQHNEDEVVERVLERVEHGKHVAVVSDAGMPVVSDPGARLVAAAHAADIPVVVIPGPSSVVTAIAASGFGGDRFVFEGFLPQKKKDRDARLSEIAREARTVALFEAPHRVVETISELAEFCGAERMIVLARELTKMYEEIWRGSLGECVKQISDKEPKGEYVLVLEGATSGNSTITDADISAALDDALAAGRTTRDAVHEVAELLDVGKRRVYDLANKT